MAIATPKSIENASTLLMPPLAIFTQPNFPNCLFHIERLASHSPDRHNDMQLLAGFSPHQTIIVNFLYSYHTPLELATVLRSDLTWRIDRPIGRSFKLIDRIKFAVDERLPARQNAAPSIRLRQQWTLRPLAMELGWMRRARVSGQPPKHHDRPRPALPPNHPVRYSHRPPDLALSKLYHPSEHQLFCCVVAKQPKLLYCR